MQVMRVYGAALLRFGLLIGLLFWNLAAFWVPGEPEELPTRLTWGVAAAIVGAAIMGTLDLIGERRAGTGQTHGPRQSATVAVRGSTDLPHRVKVALLSLPAEIREADEVAGRYTAETGWSWASSGEYVTVELTGHSTDRQARVASRPRTWGQLLDFGRGRRNVNRVVEALQA